MVIIVNGYHCQWLSFFDLYPIDKLSFQVTYVVVIMYERLTHRVE